LAVVGLWVRSVSWNDALSVNVGRSRVFLNAEFRGVLQLSVVTPSPYPDEAFLRVANRRVPDTWGYRDYAWHFAGFGFGRPVGMGGRSMWRVAVPYWAMALASRRRPGGAARPPAAWVDRATRCAAPAAATTCAPRQSGARSVDGRRAAGGAHAS
jgi:hypothetical protein